MKIWLRITYRILQLIIITCGFLIFDYGIAHDETLSSEIKFLVLGALISIPGLAWFVLSLLSEEDEIKKEGENGKR